jgi:hypothetical protein
MATFKVLFRSQSDIDKYLALRATWPTSSVYCDLCLLEMEALGIITPINILQIAENWNELYTNCYNSVLKIARNLQLSEVYWAVYRLIEDTQHWKVIAHYNMEINRVKLSEIEPE